MATASLLNDPTTSVSEALPAQSVQPNLESAASVSRAKADPLDSSRLGLDDICSLLLLLVLGVAAVSLPWIVFTKMFSAAAQFSSLDIVRMMAGMP